MVCNVVCMIIFEGAWVDRRFSLSLHAYCTFCSCVSLLHLYSSAHLNTAHCQWCVYCYWIGKLVACSLLVSLLLSILLVFVLWTDSIFKFLVVFSIIWAYRLIIINWCYYWKMCILVDRPLRSELCMVFFFVCVHHFQPVARIAITSQPFKCNLSEWVQWFNSFIELCIASKL